MTMSRVIGLWLGLFGMVTLGPWGGVSAQELRPMNRLTPATDSGQEAPPLRDAALITPLQGRVQVANSKYRLGPGDVVLLKVYNEPEMDQADVLIRPDGFASFNGIGEVQLADKTVEEASDTLKAALSDLLVDPQVALSVQRQRAGRVYLAGAVKHPGAYQLITTQGEHKDQAAQPVARVDLTVSNVLANAGGVLPHADLQNVQIKRAGTGETMRVDLLKLLAEGDGSQDIYLQSGDSIFVPEGHTMALNEEEYTQLLRSSMGPNTIPVRVIGNVQAPGLYELDGQSPYLNSAIGKAGGFRLQAHESQVLIRRMVDNHQMTTLKVNPGKTDIALRPNDVVYVMEDNLYTAGRGFDAVNQILSPFTSTAAAAFNWMNVIRPGWQFRGAFR